LNPVSTRERQLELLLQISNFVGRSPGLRQDKRLEPVPADSLLVRQTIDGKQLAILASALDDVLFRVDADGQDFIQINFSSGTKILLTGALIGFKPAKLPSTVPANLPKVVTTPDIVSVFEAMQEALHSGEGGAGAKDDLALLRRVFEAVVSGGEAAGFDLAQERQWLGRIPTQQIRATA
jgi:hypothetical protein